MKIGIRLLALLASGSVACTSTPARLSERAQDSVRVQPPGPGDSLAKLLRRQLTDPDPITIGQAIVCEHVRLGLLLGPEEAFLVYRRVADTVYTERDRAARRRVEAALGGRVITANCDSPPDTAQTLKDSRGGSRPGPSNRRP